jgi:hypothetical protein
MTGLIHGLGAALIGEDPCAVARIDAALYARSRPTAGGLTSGSQDHGDLALARSSTLHQSLSHC